MANSDKNILITPSVGLSTNPTIKFNGANNTPTTLRVLDDGTVSFEGTAGQLFSVTDGMTGSIFSVNDVSGIPNFEVLDTALIKVNQYQGQTVFNSSSTISNTAGNAAQVAIVPRNQTTPALIIKSAPENTATITNVSGSGSVVTYTALNTFSTNQYVTITGVNPSAYNLTNAYITSASSTQFTVLNSATGAYVSGGTATTVGQNTSNPIFEIQSSSGSSIFSVETGANNPTVKTFLMLTNYLTPRDYSFNTSWLNGTFAINGGTAAAVPLKVVGAISQTASLQEWQNSSGTFLTLIDSNGDIVFNTNTSHSIKWGSNTVWSLEAGRTNVFYPYSSDRSSIVVKGVSSQTGNLQEWQNNSSTVLAKVDSNGMLNLSSTAVTSTDPITISSNNQHGGSTYAGFITLTNATSGATNINKFIRLNGSGSLEVINSAYSNTIFSITDSGNVAIAGTYNGVTLSDTGWTTPTLSNSFTSASVTAGYRLLNGVVYLKGSINNGTAAATAFTLPSGYRPAQTTVIATQKYGTPDFTYVTINTDGTVQPSHSSTWLSGVSFPIG